MEKFATIVEGWKPLIVARKLSIWDNCGSFGYTFDLRAATYEHFFEAKSNLRRCMTPPVENNLSKSSSTSEGRSVECPLPNVIMFNSESKFAEFTIGKSSGNMISMQWKIAWNLIKIPEKQLSRCTFLQRLQDRSLQFY